MKKFALILLLVFIMVPYVWADDAEGRYQIVKDVTASGAAGNPYTVRINTEKGNSWFLWYSKDDGMVWYPIEEYVGSRKVKFKPDTKPKLE